MKPEAGRLQPSPEPPLAAGEFAAWLAAISRPDATSDVPCGECNACCRGSYFIHVRADESATLARIPAVLLFPAPGSTDGDQILGYDEEGRCPLLEGSACSIYQDRPRTCRSYDCRIFAATGLAEPGDAKAEVMARAARWRFDYADDEAHRQHQALKAGARFLLDHDALLGVPLPSTATQLAMLCIRLHELFFELRSLGDPIPTDPRVVSGIRNALLALAGP